MVSRVIGVLWPKHGSWEQIKQRFFKNTFQVQERATFNDMIAKLHRKIAANKKTIADITEMAILAFDQRDEAQSKITAFQVDSFSWYFSALKWTKNQFLL